MVVSGFGVAAAVGVAGLRPPRRRPFTAPETLAQKPLDAPADRYALGVIAYEIVSGRRLLGAGDDLAAGLAARAETSDIPRAATALAAMLAERPEHRPSTATAFAQALCAALESPPPPAAPLAAVIPPPSRPPRPAGEPPTSEALAEFARQGTFWEPPRRGVDDPDAATVVAGPRLRRAPSTIRRRPRSRRFRPSSIRRPRSCPSRSWSRAGAGADARIVRRADPSCVDPPLRVEPADRDASESMLFRTFGDAPERTPAAGPGPGTGGAHAAAGRAGADARPRPRRRRRRRLSGRPPQRRARRAAGTGWRDRDDVGDLRRTPRRRRRPAPTRPRRRRTRVANRPRPAPAIRRRRGRSLRAGRRRGQAPPAASAAPATPRGRPAPAVATTGQLVIRSTPTRAGVLVDGAWRGRTPITVRGLSVGTHAVRIVEDGYVSETRRVAVDARSAGTTVSFQLARVRGPERPAPAVQAGREDRRAARRVASVRRRRLDRRPRRGDDAAADLRFEPGAHQVRLELPGHRPWATTTTIVAGQSVRVAASLEESTER